MLPYPIIGGDSHLEVSPDQWRPFVAAQHRDAVPKVVKLDNGGDAWQMLGKGAPVPLGLNFSAGRGWQNLKPSGISYDEHPTGSGDGNQRLKEMDRDGIYAEILFPAVSGQRSLAGTLSREQYVALARGYNDWLSQAYCKADYNRLLGAAILPVTTIEDSVDELRRVATLPGIRTVVLHGWPAGKDYPTPEDDQFWQAAVDTGVPVSAHISFGGGEAADPVGKPEGLAPGQQLINFAPINRLLTRTGGGTGYCMTQLITSGVFDRFPTLRIALAECGAGWVPYYAEQADSNYMRHRYWAGIQTAYEPSWYVKRHFVYGIQDDFVAVRALRHEIGVENILWSTDFPHVATDWPDSLKLIERQFEGVPEDEKKLILHDNAVSFYKLADVAEPAAGAPVRR